MKHVLRGYEDDINRLIERNKVLKGENLKLMGEIVKFCYPESRVGVTKEYEILVKKHTHLIKQYSHTIKEMNERELELNSLRQKERTFVTERKDILEAQEHANFIAAGLADREDLSRSLNNQLKILERENRNLQEKARDQELEIGKLARAYSKTAEEATLYQEIAVILFIFHL